MKASTQRNIVRWLHIIASIPIAGYIYGPLAQIPRTAFAVKWVIVPVVVLSGLWMWKGHLVKKAFSRKPSPRETR
jgi:hypothetical protein